MTNALTNASTYASVSGDVTISRFAPSYPVQNLPGDETQFLRPGQPENPELMDYGTVDSENTPTYILFETVWHILFGRPANDNNPLNFHPNTPTYILFETVWHILF